MLKFWLHGKISRLASRWLPILLMFGLKRVCNQLNKKRPNQISSKHIFSERQSTVYNSSRPSLELCSLSIFRIRQALCHKILIIRCVSVKMKVSKYIAIYNVTMFHYKENVSLLSWSNMIQF